MTYTLFYNTLTGAAAIGDITEKVITTTKVFADGSFGVWSHIVQIPSTNVLSTQKKLFFYNKDTREAAIGIIEGKTFTTTKVFPQKSFGRWTHIAATGPYLFFYDQNSGAAAIATTEPKQVQIEKSIIGEHVKPDMVVNPGILDISNHTNLPQMGDIKNDVHQASFQDQPFTTVTSYAQGSFGTWTHVVSCGLYLFFYNKDTGAGSILKLQDEELATVKDFAAGEKVSLATIKNFAKGSFSPWTHVVGAAPYLFFYNEGNGAASIGKLSDAGLSSIKDFAQKSFGVWTHIVAGADLLKFKKGISVTGPGEFQKGGQFEADGSVLLFYNEMTGAGALGNLSNGGFTTVKTFDDGSFGDWTSIAGTSTASDPFAFGYRLSRTPTSLRVMSYDGSYSEVSLKGGELSAEKKEELLTSVGKELVDMLKKNAGDIKNGNITARDIGGMVYGASSAAIAAVFLPPVAGLELLSEITGISFVDASKHIGAYYGSVADKILNALNGQDTATLPKIVSTLATAYVVAQYLPIIPIGEEYMEKYLGIDAWSLTEAIGNQLGEAAEDSIKTITDAIKSAANTIIEVPGGVVDEVKDFLGL